jgi:hypothetical protein
MQYVRIYADPSGESHFEDLEVALNPIPGDPSASPIVISAFIPADQCAFVRCPPAEKSGWQTAPRRQFVFVLAGENETEVSDGEVRRFAPGSILLFEDTVGKGHNGRFIGAEVALLAIVELPD